MNIQFLGAAGEVTGSCYLVEGAGLRFLVDCGLFQGGREAAQKNLNALPFDPRSIDFVVLTHAHIDHSGLLPRLVALGFRGPIYTTAASESLLKVLLPDSAHLQENEAAWGNRKRHTGMSRGPANLAPLYTVEQAYTALKHIKAVPYGQAVSISPQLVLKFFDAGHILGAAIVQLTWSPPPGSKAQPKTWVFSGDIGQPGQMLMKDPTPILHADVLLVESTYGNRLHKSIEDTEDELVDVIKHTMKAGGNVIMPAFAVGRTQEVLYILIELVRQQRLPPLRVFVDSPMATEVTHLTYRYCALLDTEAQDAFAWQSQHKDQIDIHFTADVEESKRLNHVRSGAVIISASGMCNAGRILHHLFWNLPHQQSAVVITGFQAQGTLGRRLVDGVKSLKMLGEHVRVKASVHTLGGLSAHADQAGLLQWLGHFKEAPAQVFVVHGEHETAQTFAQVIRSQMHWPQVTVPQHGDTVELH